MKLTLSILSFTLFSFVVLEGCKESKNETSPKTNTQDSVSVFILQKQKISKQLIFPSELVPFERAEIFAKVSGYIKEIKVDMGDQVVKGQVLALLEAPEIITNITQINSEVQFAKSKHKLSLDAFQRIVQAAKVNGTVATGELEKSRNQMLADSATYEATKSKLTSSTQFSDYLLIRSPFNGTITQRNADAGSLAGTTNNKPLFIIENTSLLRLRVPVEEVYTHTGLDSSIISFTVDAQPDKVFKAILSRKNGVISKDTRTEIWEFIYKNENKELTSGMYANALFKLGRAQTSFAITPSAIATTLERKFIIRIKEGKAEWMDIRTGMNIEDKIEIFGKLQEGDTLLQKATDEIKVGSKLLPKKIVR